jgi:hypothetical protein
VSEHCTPAATENPFATRFLKPGALPFIFAGDLNTAVLVDRLRRSGWWGQIVGPHGCGKSALLASLVPAIEEAGRKTLLVALHNSRRRLPGDLRTALRIDAPTVIVVDGFEQLSRFNRFRLKRFCRRGGQGLLVTAHAAVGLPDVFRATPDLTTVQRVVERLQRGHAAHVTAEDVAERLPQHAGNVRETLFDLYDLYEARRRNS